MIISLNGTMRYDPNINDNVIDPTVFISSRFGSPKRRFFLKLIELMYLIR